MELPLILDPEQLAASLGADNVLMVDKGYPGAWSEWGNLADTPVEV